MASRFSSICMPSTFCTVYCNLHKLLRWQTVNIPNNRKLISVQYKRVEVTLQSTEPVKSSDLLLQMKFDPFFTHFIRMVHVKFNHYLNSNNVKSSSSVLDSIRKISRSKIEMQIFSVCWILWFCESYHRNCVLVHDTRNK